MACGPVRIGRNGGSERNVDLLSRHQLGGPADMLIMRGLPQDHWNPADAGVRPFSASLVAAHLKSTLPLRRRVRTHLDANIAKYMDDMFCRKRKIRANENFFRMPAP